MYIYSSLIHGHYLKFVTTFLVFSFRMNLRLLLQKSTDCARNGNPRYSFIGNSRFANYFGLSLFWLTVFASSAWTLIIFFIDGLREIGYILGSLI
jgi:hypothetical protein